ncbi:hypothetical protein [Desulfocapsa sulfexigens]|uniref:hypothetical protein n=1 Tax=Desulfocapsa sulfexigens TaxID=65555 RepID=UPI0012946FFD|nr:hypothetical protein [Desulfocapsa sulfexigens]
MTVVTGISKPTHPALPELLTVTAGGGVSQSTRMIVQTGITGIISHVLQDILIVIAMGIANQCSLLSLLVVWRLAGFKSSRTL